MEATTQAPPARKSARDKAPDKDHRTFMDGAYEVTGALEPAVLMSRALMETDLPAESSDHSAMERIQECVQAASEILERLEAIAYRVEYGWEVAS